MNLADELRKVIEFDLHKDLTKEERDEYGKFVKTHYYLAEARLRQAVEVCK